VKKICGPKKALIDDKYVKFRGHTKKDNGKKLNNNNLGEFGTKSCYLKLFIKIFAIVQTRVWHQSYFYATP